MMERKLAVILAVDVVGYSRMMSEDDEGTLRALREMLEAIRQSVTRYDGRVFAGAGDSVLAEFASPVQALRCAIDIQREAANRQRSQQESDRMVLRIGANLGDVIVEGDDLYGDGVNVAARLESIAKPGTVYIAESVYQQAHQQVKVPYVNLGPTRLHNIDEPVRVYLIDPLGDAGTAGITRFLRRTSIKPVSAGLTLAILLVIAGISLAIWEGPWPFFGEGADKEQAFPELAVPKRHFQVQNPADLEAADAYTIYERIQADMAAVYRRSNNELAGRYQSWRRYNVTPYLSAQHGRRFVNNYGNSSAAAYAKFEDAGFLPAGLVIAKDSFEVRENGDVVTGPLAIMEKMSDGFDPDGGNWRYTMILPNGNVFGTTGGAHSERVDFCGTCHKRAQKNDFLFFLPKEFRIEILSGQE
jgi:class 3 adenylate cyclase